MVPVLLLRTLAVVAAVAAHAGHGAAGDDHDHVSLESLGLVLKDAYGAAACDAGACVLEPYRETVVVAALGAEDLAAQSAPGANSLALKSDLEAVAHSLTQDLPPDRRKWMLGQRRQLADKIAAAESAEAGPDGGPAFVFTLQKTPEVRGHDHGHDHDDDGHCHDGDCHTHDHDHEAATGEHTHDGTTHVHAEDDHTHGRALEDDGHCHDGDCHTHGHAHEAATGEHTHDGSTHVHAEDAHDHGDGACAAPVALGTGRRAVVANDTVTEPGAYTLVVSVAGDESRRAVFAVDVRFARRAATEMKPGDRSRFLRAVSVLYNTSAAAGREIYGDQFRTMDELWAAHALLGGDGAGHVLQSGALGGDDAEDLLAKSEPHRVPTETRGYQGHRLDVRADGNDWDALGRRLVGAARERDLLAAAGGDGAAAPASDATAVLAMARRGDGGLAHPATALDATGHGAAHVALASNYAAFATLLEAAVQSVDPAVAVPYWAEGADAAVPEKTWTEDFTADPSKLLGAPPGDGGAEVKIAVEGKWAYLPVFEKDDPLDPKNPRGPRKYQGYAVPLMVAESDPIAANPFETHKTLPPIAVDHHHDAHASGSQLHHTHSGKAHRHV